MDADWDNGKREYTEDCKPWTQTQLQYAWWHMGTLLTPAWNSKAPAICVAQGASAAPAVKYRASKVLSERAFWEYFNTKRSFDGVSLACALVRLYLHLLCTIRQRETSVKVEDTDCIHRFSASR